MFSKLNDVTNTAAVAAIAVCRRKHRNLPPHRNLIRGRTSGPLKLSLLVILCFEQHRSGHCSRITFLDWITVFVPYPGSASLNDNFARSRKRIKMLSILRKVAES